MTLRTSFDSPGVSLVRSAGAGHAAIGFAARSAAELDAAQTEARTDRVAIIRTVAPAGRDLRLSRGGMGPQTQHFIHMPGRKAVRFGFCDRAGDAAIRRTRHAAANQAAGGLKCRAKRGASRAACGGAGFGVFRGGRET